MTNNHYYLPVSDKPRFTKAPQDVLVEENEHVEFQCQARGDPAPTIIWRREDGAIPQGRSVKGWVSVLTNY